MSNEQNNLGVISHLLGLITGFLGSLIMYLVIDEKKKIAKEHSKNALNFQLTVLIGYIISFILVFVFIGFLLLFAVFILNIIFCIMGAVSASEGKMYKYPISIRFLK